jgi:hypothetical protein
MPLSSEDTPNTSTPESMRQFDPERIFGDMNFASGMDMTMNIGQGISDDGVEFFTDMLGVNLNTNN